MRYPPYLSPIIMESVQCEPCKTRGRSIPADVWARMSCRKHVVATCAACYMRHALGHDLLHCLACDP